MSRASRILASASLGFVQMVLAMVFGLWFTPFLLRHVGQHDFGLWAVAAPMVAYVTLVDFGVITLLQREVAFVLGAAGGDYRNAPELPTLVGKTLRLVLWQMPVLCAAAVAVWIAMPRDWEVLRIPIAIFLIAVVAGFPFRINHALLTGLQDLTFLGHVNIAWWAVGVVVSVVGIWLGGGLYALALSVAATQVVLVGACYVRVRLRFADALPSKLAPISRAEAVGQLGKGFWITVSQLGALLLVGSDVVVIAATRGPDSVTPYTITDKLITIFTNVPLYILASAQPALSELKISARSRLNEVCSALTLAVLLLSGLVGILVLAVSRGFVGWWIGPQQFAGGLVLSLLVASMVLNHWMSVTTSALFSFGYERRISITTIACGVVTLGATVIFTRYWGLAGAPLGSVLGLLLVGLPANLFAIAYETEVSLTTVLVAIFPWAWRFLLLGIIVVGVTRRWVPSSLLGLAATSIGAVLVYAVLMLPVLVGPRLGVYVRPRVARAWTRIRPPLRRV